MNRGFIFLLDPRKMDNLIFLRLKTVIQGIFMNWIGHFTLLGRFLESRRLFPPRLSRK
jgi:hypothetical protein